MIEYIIPSVTTSLNVQIILNWIMLKRPGNIIDDYLKSYRDKSGYIERTAVFNCTETLLAFKKEFDL